MAQPTTAMSNQIELFEISNPCIGLCQSNKKGYCFGCLRHRSERQLWLQMSNEQKSEVLRLILGRSKRIERSHDRRYEQLEMDFADDWQAGELFD